MLARGVARRERARVCNADAGEIMEKPRQQHTNEGSNDEPLH